MYQKMPCFLYKNKPKMRELMANNKPFLVEIHHKLRKNCNKPMQIKCGVILQLKENECHVLLKHSDNFDLITKLKFVLYLNLP